MSKRHKSLIPKESKLSKRKPPRLEGAVQNLGIKEKKKEKKSKT